MPHLIIEHSANVAAVADIAGLVDAVHLAALATGVAPLDALRTRAASREHFAIGDRHPDNMFVALTARLGAGRSDDDKAVFVRAMMDALTDYLGEARQLRGRRGAVLVEGAGGCHASSFVRPVRPCRFVRR